MKPDQDLWKDKTGLLQAVQEHLTQLQRQLLDTEVHKMAGLINYGKGLQNLGEQSLSSYFNKKEALIEAERQAKFASRQADKASFGYGAGIGLEHGIRKGAAKDATTLGAPATANTAATGVYLTDAATIAAATEAAATAEAVTAATAAGSTAAEIAAAEAAAAAAAKAAAGTASTAAGSQIGTIAAAAGPWALAAGAAFLLLNKIFD